ncbi:MAG: GWxTD domain-containing protein [Acidobacteriota bacterium]|nr:GWxTD domain-containing protein [Acidobacteriota bacterium]
MKNVKKIALILLFSFISLNSLNGSENLSNRHKEWLNLVSPILTKVEKDVFLKLKTPQERDKFIQLFWARRDPLPDTKENEFYKEYMIRVRFADLNFGHGTSKKGHETERGYFYLLLGPPLERQVFATQSDIWPLELWYYKGEQQYGLPPYFYLIFYQQYGIGEYKLYSPGMEGPEKLIIPSSYSRALNRSTAYKALKNISGELAAASLTYLPGETTLGTTSLSSESIVSNVYSLAEKKFSDAYARHFLAYKDYIETEYSHDFIESHTKVKVFQNSGQMFLHWALEPTKINFSNYKGNHYAAFQLIIKIEDADGNPILEKEEEIPLSISPENYKKHERQLFAFQDVVPVIPGNFTLLMFVKNKTAKDFTTFQTNISIPEIKDSSFIGDAILYHRREKLKENQREKLKAFTFNGTQYLTNTQNQFFPQQEIGLYCQIFNIQYINSKSLHIEIFPINEETPVYELKKPLTEIITPDSLGVDIPSIVPSTLKPGYYQARITVVDSGEEQRLIHKENFIILAESYPVIPWIYSKLHKPFPNSDDLYLLAYQYFRRQDFHKAKQSVEKSLAIKESIKGKILLAKTLFALHQYQDSLEVAIPIYETTGDREVAKILAVDYAGLKDWSSALIYLEKLLSQATEISVLNLAAECYFNLNLPEKALPLLQRSLELDPNQEKIIELKKKIEEKKGRE